MKTDSKLLIDGSRGIYVPQAFAENYNLQEWGICQADIAILKAGPEHAEYWDVWDEVLMDAEWTNERGMTYALEQDQDLYAVSYDLPAGFSEYILPNWTLPALVNDDWTGLSDEESGALSLWLQRVKPEIVSPSAYDEGGFYWHHDGPGLAADCTLCAVKVRQ